ncbi:MAG: hypothetical protein RM347_034465 [Nostoc sp. ChiQUE02]|uniref:hypothetical protein n=1 Tax=Nostoc sp. ChiQUE02 TaxID=3075377 RepID=UPI002AD3AC30|nr:hypothetical protein [Nostoc sp. ChiQUE02]MDZ8232830.1 hypothetical protein [Nostoc sp. ChiQUE02]
MKLHQRQLPEPSQHFSIAFKAVVLIPHSLELFLVPFSLEVIWLWHWSGLIQAIADGTLLLAEKHCPICAVATACIGMCRMELEIFQAALGEDITIERTEHILNGDRRCVYRVTV